MTTPPALSIEKEDIVRVPPRALNGSPHSAFGEHCMEDVLALASGAVARVAEAVCTGAHCPACRPRVRCPGARRSRIAPTASTAKLSAAGPDQVGCAQTPGSQRT